ncbi:MAG: hypothetical protein RR228_00580 [Bacilli bacterium]
MNKNRKTFTYILMIITMFFMSTYVYASTGFTYKNKDTVLNTYYNNIYNKGANFNSNTSLLTKDEYDKTLLISGNNISTYLYNERESLFNDKAIDNKVYFIDASGNIVRNKDINSNSFGRQTAFVNRDSKVKGSGTPKDPYLFDDQADIIFNSIRLDGSLVTNIPKTGNYELLSSCNGGSVEYINNTLSAKITSYPLECSLEFFTIKNYKVSLNIIGATTDVKEIIVEPNKNAVFKDFKVIDNSYNVDNPYIKCNDKKAITLEGNTITVSNVNADTQCQVILKKKLEYSSSEQTYVVPYSGHYNIIASGSAGAGNGGAGDTKGFSIYLSKGQELKLLIGGQDGTGGGGSGKYYGGGATTIKLNNIELAKIAGGGGGPNGGIGGSGDALGGTSSGAGAGSNGINGGGGGSSPDYNYECNCSTCGGGCISYNDTYSCNCSTCGGGCNSYASTYDCNCTSSGGGCVAWNSTYKCNCSTCGGGCASWNTTCSRIDAAGGCHGLVKTCVSRYPTYYCYCQTCGGGCKSYSPVVQSCQTCGGGCNGWAPTYSCGCSTCGGGCASYGGYYSCYCSTCTTPGKPGNGGTTVKGADIIFADTSLTKNSGKGKVEISYEGK